MSCGRACRLAQFSRAAWYRKSRAEDQTALRVRVRNLAHARPRFGYQRISVLLRREGWRINRKRVRRLYRLDGLQLRIRVRRRKHRALHRGPAPVPVDPSERWSMDFMHGGVCTTTSGQHACRRSGRLRIELRAPRLNCFFRRPMRTSERTH